MDQSSQLYKQQNNNNFNSSSTADIVEILQLEPSNHTPFARSTGLLGWQFCVYALTRAERCVHLCVCASPCLCVGEWEGVWGWEGCRWTACEGQQFRGPVSRITWQPYPMKAYAQMNLLSKWVNQRGRVGERGVWGGAVHTAAAAPARPACLSAYISHHCPSSSVSNSFLSPLSVTVSFSQRALSIRLYFSLSLPISLIHSRSCNAIVSLENSLFLNWIGRLSSRCFDRVLSSYAHRQWTVKKTVKTDVELKWLPKL